MSLQFDVEEFIRPLVSALYESSEEDMEIDSASVTAIEQDQDADSDIEVIACYRETPVYPPQLAGGRAMTFDHDAHTDDEIQYFCGPSGSLDSTFDPSDSLVDWLVGNPPFNLTVQMTRITVWPIAANWSQYHIHRCHPHWLIKGHRRIMEMTSGLKGQNKLIRGSPINTSLDWQSAQVGLAENRITSNGAIVQCVENRSQLYKRRSLLDTWNKPTSLKKPTHNVLDDEMLS